MKKTFLFVIALCGLLQLSGCTSYSDDGSVIVDCSGFFEDLSDCVEEADAMCWNKGGYVARWYDNDPEGRRMRVRCADKLK